jgi:hypothetical protein
MKSAHRSLALAAALISFAYAGSSNAADCELSHQWSTVDHFVEAGVTQSTALSIAVSGQDLYVSGSAARYPETSPNGSWVVRKSKDAGASWETADEFHLPGLAVKYTTSMARSVSVDPVSGAVYVAGAAEYYDDKSKFANYWIVRKSDDRGGSWRTVDLVETKNAQNPLVMHQEGGAHAVQTAPDGTVYVAGSLVAPFEGGKRVDHWIVRRSTDGGATWITVDDYVTGVASFTPAQARTLIVSSAGVLVGGFNGTTREWIVRHSADGVTGWKTVDAFKPGYLPMDTGAEVPAARGSLWAPSGPIFVGSSYDSEGNRTWIVRRASSSDLARWETVEELSDQAKRPWTEANSLAQSPISSEIYVGGSLNLEYQVRALSGDVSDQLKTEPNYFNASARALSFDSGGNLFSVGMQRRRKDGAQEWFVRKNPCAP